MACIELPKIELPRLPAPLSIEPPSLPALSADVTICCKLVAFRFGPYVPLGPLVINPGVIALINAAADAVEGFLDAIPLECPRE